MVLSGSSLLACEAVQFSFDGGRPIFDAGVLLLADIERRLGIAERLVYCIEDPRSPGRVHPTTAEMIVTAVCGAPCGLPHDDEDEGPRRIRRACIYE